MSNEMVERVARAIYPKIAWAYKWDGNALFDQLNEHAKEVLFDVSRAAIEATMEPTEAMVDAGEDFTENEGNMDTVPSYLIEQLFRAMLQAALKEGE